MAKRRYENISIFPLEFRWYMRDGVRVPRQTVESGEVFERDFASSPAPEQEAYLINTGVIRHAPPPPPPPEEIRRAVSSARTTDDAVEEDDDVDFSRS